MKPYAESCDANRDPILAILREEFAEVHRVLEIGSGTGQHAVYFAEHLPHLIWQTGDLPANHPGIQMWLDEANLPNTRPPIILDANEAPWSVGSFDGVFTANTFHIMSWPEVERTLYGVGQVLEPGGVFCVYGPFNYNGAFTSESNARFDQWLKNRDPKSGVRDFEAICACAAQHGMTLMADHTMPVNNRTLVFHKQGA